MNISCHDSPNCCTRDNEVDSNRAAHKDHDQMNIDMPIAADAAKGALQRSSAGKTPAGQGKGDTKIEATHEHTSPNRAANPGRTTQKTKSGRSARSFDIRYTHTIKFHVAMSIKFADLVKPNA